MLMNQQVLEIYKVRLRTKGKRLIDLFPENLKTETKRLDEERKNLRNLQFGLIPVELVGFNR